MSKNNLMLSREAEHVGVLQSSRFTHVHQPTFLRMIIKVCGVFLGNKLKVEAILRSTNWKIDK